MIRRFFLYAILRNLRFFDAFFVLFLLLEMELSYTWVGVLLAYEKVLLGLLEIPLAVASDRLGRRSGLAVSFCLAAVAFVIFALSVGAPRPIWTLLAGLTVYGVAESLRTGSHKAIALDWLRTQGLSAQRTQILGQMRFYSKTSGGVAALVGAAVVWQLGAFGPLFWLATIPTLAGAALLMTYPTELEGELRRHATGTADAPPSLRQTLSRPEVWLLIVPSVLFESQVKLLTAYLQPAVASGSESLGLPILGGLGALIVGVYMTISGVFAGGASLLSERLTSSAGGLRPALTLCHMTAAIFSTIAGLAYLSGLDWVGLGFLLVMAAIQNARRPVFITALDDEMDGAYRATMLSAESQARSWCYAIASVSVGVIADRWHLGGAFLVMAAVLWIAAGVSARTGPSSTTAA